MMIIVNRTEELITGSVNGEQFGVSFDEAKYNTMLALRDKADRAKTMEEMQAIVTEFIPLTKESYKELVETKTPYLVVNKHSNKFYLRYANKVSSKSLPQVFVDKILKSVEKNIDITPLIKCWARYMRPVPGRPAYTEQRAKLFAEYIGASYTNTDLTNKLKGEGLADSVARERATTSQVSITMEGLLVCYKVSREIRKKYDLNENEEVIEKSRYKKNVDPDTGYITYDEPSYAEDRLFEPYCMGQRGDEFFCGNDKKGHFIRVGFPIYLEKWEQVGEPGQKGLHCGGLNYIAGFQGGEGAVTHNIFVDPMDIYGIAGVGFGNDGAMTVKRYFVYSTFGGVNKSIYHSSEYAALTDLEYEKLVQEAVDATAAKKEELNNLLGEAEALKVITRDSSDGTPTTTANSVLKG